ncbi:unnamed protein product [Strongylus vulgaris]|uniref:Uncharacterized protein n=1 Tax=Strongylus vulgaris TaxID=40348 RepID=A0A3P7JQ28_STRVU|nr:unnamed protein product [Strongylus vulgaris]
MYGNVRLGVGGSISLSLWVPYWIVNKSGKRVRLIFLALQSCCFFFFEFFALGIPLILKQEAAESEAAGQMSEHEQAKDRHPLIGSWASQGTKLSATLQSQVRSHSRRASIETKRSA